MTVAVSGNVGRPLRTALRLSPSDWAALIEATLSLAAARLTILAIPFSVLARRLGAGTPESTHEDQETRRVVIRRIRWAICAVSRRAPWRCKCLEQAVAAKAMLRRRGIETTMCLGVAREQGSGTLQSHAWLRCGSYYVTGGEGRERYTVVATFT